jgi:hypothetical protein
MLTEKANLESTVESKPERISQSSEIVIDSVVENVFPLFGPLLEMEWAIGWEPRIIFLDQPNVAEHMIFQTKSHYGEDYLWAVTQYVPERYFIEYTVTAVDRIWFIRVECKEAGLKTEATITYTYTGLNEKGNRRNREALDKMFVSDLKDWQDAINYYLANGKQLH